LEEIKLAKLQGKTPFVPLKFQNSTDICIQALYHAIQACFTRDPSQQPTTYQIAHGLSQAYQWKKRGMHNVTFTREMFHH
jgi:hypothetical protein